MTRHWLTAGRTVALSTGEQPAAPRDLFDVVFVLAAFWILMASLIYLYAGRKKPGPPGSGQRPEHTAGPQSSVEAR